VKTQFSTSNLVRIVFASVASMLAATPALAVGPNQNSTATAKIVKPLTLTWIQDLDLGTIVLGNGTWSTTAIAITSAGVFSCGSANVTCSGATKPAQYKVTGTNNQRVFITAPNVTLTNQNDNTKTLLLTVGNPGFVDLGNSGSAGVTFGLGGSIGVDSATTDGTYTGQFNVTVNY
jgi:hypothetical protein